MPIQTAMTELEAVNVMLTTIGEAPVNTLTNSAVSEVGIARSILNETSKEVQSRGWHFNTEKLYPLVPDVNGYINVPLNFVQVDLDRSYDGTYDIVLRGQQLYDRLNRTSIFKTTLYATVIQLFEFTQLPDVVRRYICIRAARKFQDRVVGSPALHGFAERDEVAALVSMKEAESDVAGHNIFNNSDVSRTLWR